MMIKKRLAVLACMALMAAGSMVAEAENRLEQKAVLGGTIHSVVSSGAKVTEGTVLAEVGTLAGDVPAAKASADGIVAEVRVKPGQDVNRGDIIVVLEIEDE